jgi:hypothetical protein
MNQWLLEILALHIAQKVLDFVMGTVANACNPSWAIPKFVLLANRF